MSNGRVNVEIFIFVMLEKEYFINILFCFFKKLIYKFFVDLFILGLLIII